MIVCLLLTASVQAQTDLKFRKLSKEDGLPSNKIYTTVQDDKGYIWIGTAGGLVRYDGYSFKTYKANEGNSIKSNQIKCLYNDSKGHLWIGTDGGGLTRYDYKKDQFTTFQHNKADTNSLVQNQILSLLEDSKGRLWIGTEKGVSVFDYGSERFTSYTHDRNDELSLSSGGVLSILEDRNGRIWIGTWEGGVNLLLPEDRFPERSEAAFLHIKHDPRRPYSLSHNSVWSMKEDDAGRLWFGTFGGGLNLLVFDSKDIYPTNPEEFNFVCNKTRIANENNALGSDMIYSIEQQKDILWIGTTNGLSLLNLNDIQDNLPIAILKSRFKNIPFVTYSRRDYLLHGLDDDQIIDIHIDRTGVTWLGTQKGVAINVQDRNRIPFYLGDFAGYYSLLINDFLIDQQNSLWLASSTNGLSTYDIDTDIFTTLYKFTSDGQLIPPVECLYHTKDDIIWMGTRFGLYKLNLHTDIVEKYRSSDIDFDLSIVDIEQDQEGNTWIATENSGILLLKGDSIEIYQHSLYDVSSLSSNQVNFIEIDEKGRIWIATDGGGFNKAIKQHDGSYHFTSFLGQNTKDDPPVNLVNVLKASGDDIWVGAHNMLFKYDTVLDSFFYYDKLKDNVISIHAMEIDKNNNIWIASNDGVFRYNEEKDKLAQFHRSDGAINDYIVGASYKDESGKIYFGAAYGFHAFYGEDIGVDSIVPIPEITELMLDNQTISTGEIDQYLGYPILDKHISEVESIKLSYQHKVVSFYYAVIDYQGKQNYRYEYQLKGIDKDWIDGGKINRVTYTNLQPGHYDFMVRVTNNDDYKSEPSQLHIQVLPPFWLTNWFITLVGLLLVTVIISTFKIYDYQSGKIRSSLERKVAKRTKEAEEARIEAEKANEAKSVFLANMSHEIRTPMNSMLGILELLNFTKLDQEQRTFIEIIQHSGQSLLYIINDILDFSKMESGNLKIESLSFDLRVCIEELLLLFANRAYSKSLELNYILREDVPWIIKCDQTKLKQILINLVDNALKFTDKGSIFLEVESVDQNLLRFNLTDTGVGIAKENHERLFDAFTQIDASATRKFGGSGLGLAICKGLCEAMGGTINVKSHVGVGTTFSFTIRTAVPTVEEQSHIDIKNTIEPKTVVICDDSEVNTASLKSMLASIGMTTHTIASCQLDMLPSSFDFFIYNQESSSQVYEQIHNIKRHHPHSKLISIVPLGSEKEYDIFSDASLTMPFQHQKIIDLLQDQTKQVKQPSSPIKQEVSPKFHALSILVAEDNVFNQKLILSVLSRLDYAAKLAENGVEAVEMVKEGDFDLVFMDVQMPYMDGLEATRHIRNISNIRQPIIIGLTANALEQDRSNCLDAGMDDHCSKPFNIEKIESILKSTIDKKYSFEVEH